MCRKKKIHRWKYIELVGSHLKKKKNKHGKIQKKNKNVLFLCKKKKKADAQLEKALKYKDIHYTFI